MRTRIIKNGSMTLYQIIWLGLVMTLLKGSVIDGGTGHWQINMKLRKNTNL